MQLFVHTQIIEKCSNAIIICISATLFKHILSDYKSFFFFFFDKKRPFNMAFAWNAFPFYACKAYSNGPKV